MEYVIILINGFGSSKTFWEYAFEDKPILRKLDFVDKLKTIGKTKDNKTKNKIFKFNQNFFNVNYYSTPDKKKDEILWGKIYENYKPHSSNINFNLEDLDYKNICNNIYKTVKNKYGNNKKYIVIGHSYGGPIGLLFSKLYKNDVILCCCIDNAPYTLGFYKKYDEKENKDILLKYSNNDKLKQSLKIIKNSNDKTIVNKEIDDIYKLIGYRSASDRIKYYDDKLYVPTLFFKVYHLNPTDNEKVRNKYNNIEMKHFKKDKKLCDYIIFKDAEHFIWKNQKYSDEIINNISKRL